MEVMPLNQIVGEFIRSRVSTKVLGEKMKKTIVILMLVFICGCSPSSTRVERLSCTNVQTVSGVISKVVIEKGSQNDIVKIEFADGRKKTFIRVHDLTVIFQRGIKHTIGYSGDNGVIFWVTIHGRK